MVTLKIRRCINLIKFLIEVCHQKEKGDSQRQITYRPHSETDVRHTPFQSSVRGSPPGHPHQVGSVSDRSLDTDIS